MARTESNAAPALVPVAVDNVIRAESDLMISGTVKLGGLGEIDRSI